MAEYITLCHVSQSKITSAFFIRVRKKRKKEKAFFPPNSIISRKYFLADKLCVLLKRREKCAGNK